MLHTKWFVVNCLAISVLAVLFTSSAASTASAQERGQADVRTAQLRVRLSGTIADTYDVEVTAYSDNDDDAPDVKILVFLPPESFASNLPGACTSPNPLSGLVTCSVGNLRVGQTSDPITFNATVPPTFILPRFAAFSYSTAADPDLSNNLVHEIAERTLVRETSQAPVYVIAGHAKFHVPDTQTLHRLYGGWNKVVIVPDGTLQGYGNIPVDDTYLREENAAQVWRMVAGKKQPVPSPDQLPSGRWAWVAVVPDGSLTAIPQ
jgi:hypothetical protein